MCVLLWPAARFIWILIGLTAPFFITGASFSNDTFENCVIRSRIRSCRSESGRCDGKVVPAFWPPAIFTSELINISSRGTADGSTPPSPPAPPLAPPLAPAAAGGCAAAPDATALKTASACSGARP